MKLAIVRASGRASSFSYFPDTSGVIFTQDAEAAYVGIMKFGDVHLNRMKSSISDHTFITKLQAHLSD